MAADPAPSRPPAPGVEPGRIELGIEWIIFNSRWLLAPLFLGLCVALLVYTVRFVVELWHFVGAALHYDDVGALLATLALVDAVLVGSLLVMVILGGYENFVSRLDASQASDRLAWLGKLDAGSLKLKLASSIVAISSVHLLKAVMNVNQTEDSKLFWMVVIHLTFVVSALMMAVMDRLATHGKH